MAITTQRIYEQASAGDGLRVLVDRIWPRGISRDRAALDLWLKDIAPSTQLRVWFGHDPDKFDEFASRYRQELASNPAVGQLMDLCAHHPKVTLLYGAKDTLHNQAIVLCDYMNSLSHDSVVERAQQ